VSLSIFGLASNVLEAYNSCMRVIHELKDALLCSEYVVWKYKDSRSGEMMDFPLRASNELEKAHKVRIVKPESYQKLSRITQIKMSGDV